MIGKDTFSLSRAVALCCLTITLIIEQTTFLDLQRFARLLFYYLNEKIFLAVY